MRILAVIPAYNEEACLADTVRKLNDTCPSVDYVVINDGSSDDTAGIIARERMNSIDLPVNTGLASAFKTGMKYAYRHGYGAVVQFDADGQHLPEYIAPMAAKLERGADIVVASRYLDGDVNPSGARGIGQRLITLLIRLTTGLRISDPTSGMRMYDKAMIELFAQGFDMAPEPDMLAYAVRHGMTVEEIPCKMLERQGGTSYFKLGNVIRYMSRTCLSILLVRILR